MLVFNFCFIRVENLTVESSQVEEYKPLDVGWSVSKQRGQESKPMYSTEYQYVTVSFAMLTILIPIIILENGPYRDKVI